MTVTVAHAEGDQDASSIWPTPPVLAQRMLARTLSVPWEAPPDATRKTHGVEMMAGSLEHRYDPIPDPVIVLGPDANIVDANLAATEFFGAQLDEWVGQSPFGLLHPDDLELAAASMLSVQGKQIGTPIELRVRLASGEWRLVEIVGAPHATEGGVEIVLTMRDLTERRRWEIASDDSARARTLVHHASAIVLLCDGEGRVESSSGAMIRQLGHDPECVAGRLLTDYVLPDARDAVTAALAEAVASPGVTVFEAPLCHRNGRSTPYQLSVTNLLDDPVVRGLIISATDITTRRELEDRLHHLATHDPLTGLANRTRLLGYLETALARAGAHPELLAVLFLDLDRFKPVNDIYGHEAGDQLLCAVAGRLLGAVRPTDLVARLGGDEFVVVCELRGPDATAALDVVSDRIQHMLAEPIALECGSVQIQASIGKVTAEAGTTSEVLLAEADGAMYTAKQTRRGVSVQGPTRVAERRELAEDLAAALNGDPAAAGLVVFYQPLVTPADGNLVGFEALVRWQHPQLGLLPPDRFLPVAEAGGLDTALGNWVLATAVEQLASWSAQRPDLSMAVNLSAAQVSDPTLPGRIICELERWAVAPGQLCLEITETTMLAGTDRPGSGPATSLLAIKATGVSLAIDDFGTGYSSLTHVREFPADIVKIDRSFVECLGQDREADGIVAAVIALAHATGKAVVAEGVATESQRDRLVEMGADLAQGFLYGRAVPASRLGSAVTV